MTHKTKTEVQLVVADQPSLRPLAVRRKAAAKIIGIGVSKLDQLITAGSIKAVKADKCLLITTVELERYLANLPPAVLNLAKRTPSTKTTPRG